MEGKIDSIILLFSPDINSTLLDSFWYIQYEIKETEERRVGRYRLLINFENRAKSKCDNFLSAPKEEQERLDELVLKYVYAMYIEDDLNQLPDLYQANFYRLLSGDISREDFIKSLNDFKNSRPAGFTLYGDDGIIQDLAISKETDFYKILEKSENRKIRVYWIH